jgi:hypothetical protein
MTPVLYYVYRLAALQKFSHIEDLLAEYENGNELGGWIEYFQEEDNRQLKRLTTAFGTARGSAAPTRPVPVKAPTVPEPVIDMTDPKMQQSFVDFVTGAK